MRTFHTLLVLHLPRTHADLIVYAHHIVGSMTGNSRFPSPTPALAVVTAHIQELETAEVAAKSRAKGAADARDIPLQALVSDLHQLAAYVQSVADATPAEATAIITSAGFGTQPHGVHAKPDIAAHMGLGGLVMLRAHAVGRHAAYEWQMTGDGGKTWSALPSTTSAHTAVPDLTIGQSYGFRVRGNVGTSPGDWTDTASIVVH